MKVGDSVHRINKVELPDVHEQKYEECLNLISIENARATVEKSKNLKSSR